MKQNKYYSLICMLLCSAITWGQNDLFNISGKIGDNWNGNDIMLFTFKGDSIQAVDTTKVIEGVFCFKGKPYLDGISMINIGDYPDLVMSADVVLEAGNIVVRIDTISQVSGTLLNNLSQIYADSSRIIGTPVSIAYKKYLKDKDMESLDTLLFLIKKRQRFEKGFKLRNMDNIVGQTLFIRELNSSSYDYFYEIYDKVPQKIKVHPEVLEFKAWRDKMEQQDSLSKLSVGKQFIDIRLITTDGEERNISDYVGKSKFLFIDFWASWCGPCIAEIPYIKEVYNKYSKNGLNVLSVSFDTSKEPWLKALNKLDVGWGNLVDLNGGKEIMNAYNFGGIPYGILVDETGKILAVNVRAAELHLQISKIINNNTNL